MRNGSEDLPEHRHGKGAENGSGASPDEQREADRRPSRKR